MAWESPFGLLSCELSAKNSQAEDASRQEGTAAAKGLGQDPGLLVPSGELASLLLTTEKELQKRDKLGFRTEVWS